ncbi:MAG: hypothetical protein CME16_06785 [Gemmatimonadetes bacterium]|nr:hypothetical protein [Gemmatimonadota bacterium]
MVPNYLRLKNFLSYGDQAPTLDFSKFQVACLTGDNGHGKSALLDAITYALWGEARKGSSERKPDEGLLRLGATEMRVEFGFEVGENRFRTIRSFRRGRRNNSSQLELQIYDDLADSFRPLAESSSLAQTQKRINQLLSMDYDTFINSAFIVQGRADEFTQKGARQRKEVLAEILGLSRYDRLQERARLHFQKENQAGEEYQNRLRELDTELVHLEKYQNQLLDVSTQLNEVMATIAESEKALERLRENRMERSNLQAQLEIMAREKDRLGQRLQICLKEQTHLKAQQYKDGQILESATTIEQNYRTFQQLSARDSELKRDHDQLRELEMKVHDLEKKIVAERHEVERRCEKWESRQQTLQNQLQYSSSLLARENEIETNHNLFLTTRQQERDLERQRQRYEELKGLRDRYQHEISLEKQQLLTRKESLNTQIASIHTRLREHEITDERIAALSLEVEALTQKAVELDEVKERGTTLRTRLAEQQRHRSIAEEDLNEARKKTHFLQGSSQAECPLCGSELDDDHLLQLKGELKRQEQDQNMRLEQQILSIQELENDLDGMRQHFQNLEQKIEPLEDLQQKLAALRVQQKQLNETKLELRNLDESHDALNTLLSTDRYAELGQQKLAQTEREMSDLGYDEEEHAKLRDTLAERAKAEIDSALLKEARAQQKMTREELSEASEKLQLARQYLNSKLYAQQWQQDLEDLEKKILALRYDPEEHMQVRSKIDELSDAVARRESLILAQQRFTSSESNFKKNLRELENLQSDIDELETKKNHLEENLQTLVDVEKKYADLATNLKQFGLKKDQLLMRQGALQTQLDHCTEWAAERDQIRVKLEEAQKNTWFYQQLVEAFGKDGIQALIIENAIPEIEDETNAILSRLTDNRIQISIESLRDLKKGGTRETLDIKIADEIGERSYHLYSGGEAFRTDFSLRIALSKVLARRAGTRLRVLIIDEGFGTQDSHGLEQLVEAIQEISKDFDKLLVVTHLPQLKNAFPVQIEVTKHPDIGSSFKIIENV